MNNPRQTAFEALAKHPWYKRLYVKLNEEDLQLCVSFITEHHGLGHLEFEMASNRYFLDRDKPKNWKIICELLCVVASAKS